MSDDELVPTRSGTTTVEELRARITVVEPQIIRCRDWPDATAETWAVQSRQVAAAAEPFDTYGMIIDLVESVGRPKGTHKEMIARSFKESLFPVHVAFVQPGPSLLRAALKFIVTSTIKNKVSIHGDLEGAVTAVRQTLRSSDD